MQIIAIDPGSEKSAYIYWDARDERIFGKGILKNEEILEYLRAWTTASVLAIETIEGFGLPVGQETFDTMLWAGRFIQRFDDTKSKGIMRTYARVGRKAIKSHLCGHTRANDKAIREALIYRFGKPGTKKDPGKLYGVSSHLWSALAVAVYYSDMLKEGSI